MGQLLSVDKLLALGFQQRGKVFSLRVKQFDGRRVVEKEQGCIRLDRDGRVIWSKGFPKAADGSIILRQTPACW